MQIAIHPDDYTNPKVGKCDASSPRWADLLEKARHEVKWVNVYRADILEQLKGCDGFMWRWAHFGGMGQIARRLLPVIENELGLEVYPDQATCWHYDDKIAQYYLLTAAGIPMPKTWIWFDEAEASGWARKADYPLVIKLYAGASSTNVRLVNSADDAAAWIERLFGQGVYSLASVSRAPWGWKRRIRSAAKSLLLGQPLNEERSQWYLHKNYVFFQEFIPDNPYDTRITIVGERAFCVRRYNRPNDFRASGSGDWDYDQDKVDFHAVKLGFRVAARLCTHTVSMDILRSGERRLVLEISYTAPSQQYPGYWELCGQELVWRAGPIWGEEAQVQDFLARLEKRRKSKENLDCA